MTPDDRAFLLRFRTSGYAIRLRTILETQLSELRAESLTTTASETMRLKIQAHRDLLDELFGSTT